MKVLKTLSLFLLLTTIFMSCEGKRGTSKTLSEKSQNKKTTELTGSDRDKYGCIPSAGYTWSVLKQNCIRVFETGRPLMPLKKKGTAIIPAYILFNDDKTKAELFISDSDTSIVMERGKETAAYQHYIYRYNEKDAVLYVNNKKAFRAE